MGAGIFLNLARIKDMRCRIDLSRAFCSVATVLPQPRSLVGLALRVYLPMQLSLGGFQRGFCKGGEISMIGVVCAPVAIKTFVSLFVWELLNSETFTGIRHGINYFNRCAHNPNY